MDCHSCQKYGYKSKILTMNQNSKEILAKNVKKLRTSKKQTREALSLILGFENSYISKLEKQKINITIEKLDKIADYFEVPTHKLLEE